MQHILQRSPFFKVLAALAIVSIGAIGFIIVHNLTNPVTPVATTQPIPAVTPVVGTTASIDALTTEDAAGEASISAKYEQGDQTAVDTASQVAVGVEGAFDESTY